MAAAPCPMPTACTTSSPQVDIPVIPTRQGSPAARIAVSMRNALQYDFNGGAGANAPTHRLTMTVAPTSLTVIVDLTSGRPTAEVDGVTVNYQLDRNRHRQDRAQGYRLLACRHEFPVRSSASPSSAPSAMPRTVP